MFLEIDVMRKLNTKPFINLIEIFEGESSYYLVMELMKGRNLQDEINYRKQAFSEQDSKIIIKVSFYYLKGDRKWPPSYA